MNNVNLNIYCYLSQYFPISYKYFPFKINKKLDKDLFTKIFISNYLQKFKISIT